MSDLITLALSLLGWHFTNRHVCFLFTLPAIILSLYSCVDYHAFIKHFCLHLFRETESSGSFCLPHPPASLWPSIQMQIWLICWHAGSCLLVLGLDVLRYRRCSVNACCLAQGGIMKENSPCAALCDSLSGMKAKGNDCIFRNYFRSK